ncbi:hypothetical protein [Dactylosporangium cerinum]
MPDLPPGYVLRERVVAQLDAAVRAPLTLVTAPAGWGKTAALVAWARTVRIGDEMPVVRWVTSHSPDGADVPGRLRGALSAGDVKGDLKADSDDELPRAVDSSTGPTSWSSTTSVRSVTRPPCRNWSRWCATAWAACTWCCPAGGTRRCRCTGGGSTAR